MAAPGIGRCHADDLIDKLFEHIESQSVNCLGIIKVNIAQVPPG